MGQWGLDKTAAAGGTSPADLQQIFDAEWYNADTGPVIKGGAVSGRGNLQYAYAAGVGIVPTAFGAIKVNWEADITALVSQPSVTRTDMIYVTEAGQVHVAAEGSISESNICVIDRMALPGGATATSAATRARPRNYAIPYGAQLGHIMGYQEFRSGTVPPVEIMFNGTFWVPTNSWVDVHIWHGIRTSTPNGKGWVRYRLELDGTHHGDFELPYDEGHVTQSRWYRNISAATGQHTVRVSRYSVTGSPATFFGGGVEKLPGGGVTATHMGIARNP